MDWTLDTLLEVTQGDCGGCAGNFCASGVSIDSRDELRGRVFVAIRGKRFDGHDYVNDALRVGAVCAVVDAASGLDSGSTGFPTLVVEDTIEALSRMASHVRNRSAIPWVATTGSAGKSTTKEYTASALSSLGPVLKAPKSFNNNIGVPLTMLGLEDAHSASAIEIGMNAPGEIAQLSEFVCPTIGAITNIGSAHLARFGSVDAIAREKAAILDHLAEDGIAVLPADSEHYPYLLERARRPVISFGLSPLADVRPETIEPMRDGSLIFSYMGVELRLGSGGLGGVRNALCALASAQAAGVDPADAAKRIAEAPQLPMRSQLVERNGVSVLVDCYNANPESFRSALQSWMLLPCRNRRWVVAGDMKELGDETKNLHVELGSQIARAGAQALLAVGENAEDILTGAIQAGMGDVSIKKTSSAVEACAIAIETARDGDLILVKGSRSVGLESVAESLLGTE